MAIPAPRWDLLGEGKERFLGCTTAGLAGEHDRRRLPLASAPSGSPDRPRPDPSAVSRRYTLLAATAPGRALRPPLPPLRRPPARRMVRAAGVAGGTNQQRPGGIGAAGGRDGTGLAAGASPGAKRAERPPREIEVPGPRRGEEREALPPLPASPVGRRIRGGGR